MKPIKALDTIKKFELGYSPRKNGILNMNDIFADEFEVIEKALKDLEVMKKEKAKTQKSEAVFYATFTDYGKTRWDKEIGKANRDLVDFLNKHPDITIISLNKRTREIENCGNGNEYYDLDLVYKEIKR